VKQHLKKDYVLIELKDRKKSADSRWKIEFEKALNGWIDKESLGIAMQRCNDAEAALMYHEARNKRRNPFKL